jgi:hypothetical protein
MGRACLRIGDGLIRTSDSPLSSPGRLRMNKATAAKAIAEEIH